MLSLITRPRQMSIHETQADGPGRNATCDLRTCADVPTLAHHWSMPLTLKRFVHEKSWQGHANAL